MIKWALTIGIIYLIYRYVMAIPRLKRGDEQPPLQDKSASRRKEDEDYVDYEEVD